MKLLVRNLARQTTEQDMRALFSAHGKVELCTLVFLIKKLAYQKASAL